MGDVLVSICCTTYNHEQYIQDAIEGFLRQKTNFNYEILIGEDCSTDRTKKIVEEFVRAYPDKVRIVASEHNVGGRKNMYRLFQEATGKYIALCEGDDYWTDPYKLQLQVEYMESNPTCTLCFHAAEIVDASKKPTGQIQRSYSESRISPTADIIVCGGTFCPTVSLLFPAELMKNPPSLWWDAHVGDYPLQMFLASRGYAYYIDKVMSAYRTGVAGSWTTKLQLQNNNWREKQIEHCEANISLLNQFDKFTNNRFVDAVRKARDLWERQLFVHLAVRFSGLN